MTKPNPDLRASAVALMRDCVRGGCRDRPGVYRMLAQDGEVLYVGKSKRVRTRLLGYFRCGYPEDKGARILYESATIDWEYTPSEFAALLQELKLIKRFRPRFNVAMKRDARHYAFIKVTAPPASKMLVVRGAGSNDGGSYYGPYLGAQRVGEAVRELNDVLGLRDCALDQRMNFADQTEIFTGLLRTPGCIRHEIGRCLGPCIGGCTVAQYAERVALARLFLEGSDDGPLHALREQMASCSERLEFERAAAYRDKLRRLEELREQFARLRFAVETLSFVYTVPGHDGEDRAYIIRRGRVRAECPAPNGRREQNALRRMAGELLAPSEGRREPATVPAHEIDELLLLSSWFRRFPGELARTRSVKPASRSRSA